MKSGLKRQEIEIAWEEVGDRRRFGSFSKCLIMVAGRYLAETPLIYSIETIESTQWCGEYVELNSCLFGESYIPF
jgi:hypothetical protein